MHIVAGIYRHRKIVAPKGQATRPTAERLRESLFNICQGYIQDVDFLDLYAGSGAMGIEALSRGASNATFVDSHKESIRAIRENFKNLGIENSTQIFQGDVFEFIEKQSKRAVNYGIIFADPPYHADVYKDLLRAIDTGTILAPQGTLFIEVGHGTENDEIELKTLRLVSSRHMGRSVLLQFQR